MIKLQIDAELTLGEATKTALAAAEALTLSVTMSFGSVEVDVSPGESAGSVYDSYFVKLYHQRSRSQSQSMYSQAA